VKAAVELELDEWAKYGVEGHFHSTNPWYSYHERLTPPMAEIVGAKESEVVCMNSLTTNIHLMFVSFYRPTKARYKIISERGHHRGGAQGRRDPDLRRGHPRRNRCQRR
jgi:kynureninase